MFKKIIISIFFLVFLASCGGEESLDLESQWLVKYAGDKFDISIPSNWNILNDKQNSLPQPSEWKIELSAQSQEARGWFFNNVLVLSDELKSFTDSQEFAIANNVWARSQYLEYLELENKPFNFIDGTQSHVYIFEAKYNMETPKIKFIQTAYVCNPNTWYLLTMAVSPSIKVTEKYETLLSTFSCSPETTGL